MAKAKRHCRKLFSRAGFIVTNLCHSATKVVDFYNRCVSAVQWIRKSKHAMRWTYLSCPNFAANQVRRQLHLLAYNLDNFLRRLTLPASVKRWTLTTLRGKPIKIGAKMVRYARYVTFQLAEVAIPRPLHRAILDRILRFAKIPPRAAAIWPHVPMNNLNQCGAALSLWRKSDYFSSISCWPRGRG